ncbi:unnamed protein product, partial [Urochloa humidicola]
IASNRSILIPTSSFPLPRNHSLAVAALSHETLDAAAALSVVGDDTRQGLAAPPRMVSRRRAAEAGRGGLPRRLGLIATTPRFLLNRVET